MSLNFPNTPAPGDVHNENGSSWTWDGTAWLPSASLSALIDIVGSGFPTEFWTVVGDVMIQGGRSGTDPSGNLAQLFLRPFKNTPRILISPNNALGAPVLNLIVSWTAVDQYGFNVVSQIGNGFAGTVGFDWVAIGEALDADKMPKAIQTVGGGQLVDTEIVASGLPGSGWQVIGDMLVQWGTINSAVSAATTLTFPKGFKTTPAVQATANNTLDVNVTAEPFSTTQARLRAFSQTGVLAAGAVPMNWFAVGEALDADKMPKTIQTAGGEAGGGFETGDFKWRTVKTAPIGWRVADGAALLASDTDAAALRALYIAEGNPHGVSGSDPLLPNLLDGAVPGDGGRFVRAVDGTARAVGSKQAMFVGDHQHLMPMGFDVSNFYGWHDGASTPIFGSETAANATRLRGAGTQETNQSIRVGKTRASADAQTGDTRPVNIGLLPLVKL